jgi:hypothetical protein
MKLLITSSRMPFALDAIRKLGERGHEVFATGALLAGIPSVLAVIAGVHWLGVAIAVAAFATWCAWLARRPEGALWT